MKLSEQIERRPLLVAFGTSQQTGGLTSVDLEATRDDSQVILTASDGSAAPVAGADATTAGVMTAADKVSLDGLPPTTTREFAARAEIAGATVSAAITQLRSAGYAMAGDGGGALYKRAGAEPAHALKVPSADGAWWELVPDPAGISVRQAGAVGDGVTDDGQAFLDALAGVEDFNVVAPDKAVHRVVVPPGDYNLGTTTLELKKVVHLLGSNGGMAANTPPVILRWDANVTGIIVHRHNTLGAGKEATPTGGADSSIIEGLKLVGAEGTIAGVTDSTKGHGIWLRARAVLRNLAIENFPGNGINIVATAGGADDVEGNANNWLVETVRIVGCHLSGMFVAGADVNASLATLVDATANGRWGIHDSSFLGNTYIGPHSDNNGTALKGENGSGESSYVSFGGRRYSANVNATEADLVATQPGTDESVWLDTASGGTSTNIPLWTASQPEGTYFHGGSYRSQSVTAKSIFMGGYTEINHGAAQFVYPTQWFGGEGFTPKGTYGGFSGGSTGMNLHGKLALDNHALYTPARDLSLTLNPAVNALFRLNAEGDTANGWQVLWDESSKTWTFGHASLDSRKPLRFTTDLNTQTYGRATAADVGGGRAVFEQGVWIGSGALTRFHSANFQVPTSGAHAAGDRYYNTSPSPGEALGWVCTAAGTPGTWAEMRGHGTQTSGTNQAAITNSTAGTQDGTLAAVSGSGDDATINDNFTDLHTLLDEVRTTLVAFGLMKGGA